MLRMRMVGGWPSKPIQDDELPILNTTDLKRVMVEAAEKEDRNFFVWIGKIVSRKFALKIPPLTKFLLDHWDRAVDGLPELFYLSKSGVTDVCCVALGESITEDAVIKQCRRMELLTFTGKKIRVEQHVEGLRFVKPNGKSFAWIKLRK